MSSKINTFLVAVLSFLVICLIVLLYLLSPVSSEDKEVVFTVTDGESLNEIASNLKKEGLIKNEKFFLGYLVLKNSKEIYLSREE